MVHLFLPFLALALQWFRPRYNAQLQLLEAQIPIPRSRITVCQATTNCVGEVMHMVQPETYRRWVRQ